MPTRYFSFIIFCFALASCQNENPVKQEYESIEKGSAKLSGAQIFVLDSIESEINWVVSSADAKVLKGTLHPSVGSILVEKERILAGFWEGRLFSGSLIEKPADFEPEAAIKALKDSNQRLYRAKANRFHFDLAQVNRQILRSDFKVSNESNSKETASHIFQGNLSVADSVLFASLPVNLNISPKRIQISGTYRLNYSDFGIFSKSPEKLEMSTFQPAAELKYKLIFNNLQK